MADADCRQYVAREVIERISAGFAVPFGEASGAAAWNVGQRFGGPLEQIRTCHRAAMARSRQCRNP
jgi:hypothetical protein